MSAEALSPLSQCCLLVQTLLQELDEALRLRRQQACLGERIERRGLALPCGQYPARSAGCHVIGGNLLGQQDHAEIRRRQVSEHAHAVDQKSAADLDLCDPRPAMQHPLAELGKTQALMLGQFRSALRFA